MKKLIMIFAILAMAGAASLGVMNMKTLQSEQALLAEAQEGIKKAKQERGALEDKLVTAEEDRDAAKDDAAQTRADLSLVQQNLMRQEATIMTMKKDLEKAKVEKKEIDLVIQEVGADSVEDLEKNVQAQKDMLADRQNQLQQAMAELESKNQETMVVMESVRDLQTKRVEHAKTVALNGLEATVIAVNREWGFVMVNVGKALGVSAEASLLVKRGGERIARLRITDISDDVLMSEIIDGSLAEGASVSPGDKVIFENTK